MSTAQKIFIGYGMLVLVYGLYLGIPLAAVRAKKAKASRHLVNSHLSGLMQGPVHFGLAFAVGIVGFDSVLATAGAALLVAGTAMETLGGTLNWLQETGDQFAEKSVGFKFNALSGVLALPGITILAFGVLSQL